MFWLGRTKSLYHSSFGSWFLELEPTKDLDPPSQYMNQFWLGPAKRDDILWLVYYFLDLDPPSQFWLGPTKPLCYCLFGLLFLGFGPTKIHGSPEGQHNLVALWIAVCKMLLMTFRESHAIQALLQGPTSTNSSDHVSEPPDGMGWRAEGRRSWMPKNGNGGLLKGCLKQRLINHFFVGGIQRIIPKHN